MTDASPGRHELEVFVFDRRRLLRSRIAARSLCVTDNTRHSPTLTAHLDSPPAGGLVVARDATIKGTDLVHFNGRAFRAGSGAPLNAAALLVDGEMIVPIAYGRPRSDVGA